MDGFWIDDLDLSTLTSEQFSTFFFDRPIVADEATRELFLGEFEAFAISVSHPAAMVANVEAMCQKMRSSTTSIQFPKNANTAIGVSQSTNRKWSRPSSRRFQRYLALDHRGCQICALHGLGHLYHPYSEQLGQRYLDEHRTEFSAEAVRWIEDCRDSSVQ